MGVRETYAQRKAREARRDAIIDVARGMAEHIAMSDLMRVERTNEEWPRFRFSRLVSGHRCECGMPAAPVPHRPDAFGGVCPWWLCPVCSLPEIIKAYERVGRMVDEPA